MGEEDKSVRQKDESQELMLRYLSGDLSEDEHRSIEEKFFADDQYFEEMLAAEDSLIDDFVQGKLPSGAHDKLDRFLRSSPYELREKEFVKELIKNVSEAGPLKPDQSGASDDHPKSKLQSVLAFFKTGFRAKQLSLAALLLLGILSIPIMIWNLTLQRRLRQIEADRIALQHREQQLQEQIVNQNESNLSLAEKVENERNLRSQLEKDLDDLIQSIPKIARAAVASVVLTTEAITRGDAHVPTVHLQPETRQLRIEIELERSDNYKNYSAVIRTYDGRRIWNADEIPTNQAAADRRIVVLPARIFASDDYILTLSGQIDGGDFVDLRDYSFRVRR